MIYEGEGQGKRTREPLSWDGYVSASAELPDDVADLLWPGTEEEAGRRADLAARVRAALVDDLPDETLHEFLFGSTTCEESAG